MGKPTDRPGVLLVTRNYPPLTGGMERLMLNMSQGVADWANLTIVGPRGCSEHCPAGATVYETPAGLAPFLLMSAWHALRACKRRRFHIMLGGSGLAAPVLALARRIYGGKTAVFVHGLDLVVASAIYQAVFIPCIRRADLVISNSENTRKLAIDKGVSARRIEIINPGAELPDIKTIEPGEAFCARHAIRFKKIMIFVGRMTRRKGLSRFIEHSLPAILAAEPEAGLVVVGDNPNQGLTDFGEQKEVLAIVKRLRLENSIVFLGTVSDADLLACYAMADVQIFPLIDVPGDVEGFGMVAVEAAACGTPTVAFAVGGVADAISQHNGAVISPGDYAGLTAEALNILRTGLPSADTCRRHSRQYDWLFYGAKLHKTLKALLSS